MLTLDQKEKLIKDIHAGRVSVYSLPTFLYREISKELDTAVLSVWRVQFGSRLSMDLPNRGILQKVRRNVYEFSSHKAFWQVNDIEKLIFDNKGFPRPFSEVRAEAMKVVDLYNEAHLKTEVATARGQARMAQKWDKIQEDKDIFQYLQYVTVGDARVRDEHAVLDGVVKHVDDPFWNVHTPENGWNCFLSETKVLTPLGYVPIRTIVKGDLVIGGSGQVKPVLFTQVRNTNTEIIELGVKGDTVSSTPNHRILTIKGWVFAENIKAKDIVIDIIPSSGENRIVAYINKWKTCIRNLKVAFHRQRESIGSNTLNPKINLRDKYIDILSSYDILMNNRKPHSLKMVDSNLFAFSRRSICDNVIFGMKPPSYTASFLSKLRCFFIKKRTAFFERLRNLHKRFVCVFGLSVIRMHLFLVGIFKIVYHNFRLLFFSFIIIDPLRLNSIRPVSNWNVKLIKQLADGSIAYSPLLADFPKSHHFDDISIVQGFTDGAPLHFFDSVYDFQRYCFHSCDFSVVEHISKIQKKQQYTYNLSIKDDISYCVKGAIVHNCRCTVIQLRSGRETPDDKIDFANANIDESFKFNPGQTGEAFSKKSHPYFTDVPEQFKAAASRNFGFELPSDLRNV